MEWGFLKNYSARSRLNKKALLKKSTVPQRTETVITVDSSPKEVINYIFQQMATGINRDDLLQDLAQRGFHKKTAEEYVDLVNKTMFKGR